MISPANTPHRPCGRPRAGDRALLSTAPGALTTDQAPTPS